VVSSRLQGQVAAAHHPGPVPDGGRPVQHLQLGARPPAAPQVHGHGRGPAQLEPRILLLSRRLGPDDAPSGFRVKGFDGGHDRHGVGLGGDVAVQAVRSAGRHPVVRPAHCRAVVAVGRGPFGRPPGRCPAPASAHAALHVSHQQRRAHVGSQTVRQVSSISIAARGRFSHPPLPVVLTICTRVYGVGGDIFALNAYDTRDFREKKHPSL